MNTIDWPARYAALVELDGEALEIESEQYETDWIGAYTEAFVRIAVSRGWKREDAETWPSEIGQDAMISSVDHEHSPELTAEADVIACEQEV